jgi:hypothetical protein
VEKKRGRAGTGRKPGTAPRNAKQDELSGGGKIRFPFCKSQLKKNESLLKLHGRHARPIGVGMKCTKYAEPTGTQQDEKQKNDSAEKT